MFALLEDDEKFQLHLGDIAQNLMQGLSDHLFTCVDPAPSIGPDPFHLHVDFLRQVQHRVAGDREIW